MGDCPDSAAATLDMTVFQKMRQLIAVFGMYRVLDGVGCLLRLFGCPASCVATGLFGSAIFDLILDGLRCLLHILFQVIHGKVFIFLQSLHHFIRQLVDLYRLAHRRSFLHLNLSQWII